MQEFNTRHQPDPEPDPDPETILRIGAVPSPSGAGAGTGTDLALRRSAGEVHSAHKEATMEEHSLTFGAHLLLWVFPLTLVVLVIAEDLLDRRKREPER